MPKFTVFTNVRNGLNSVSFAPGDDVPAWAYPKVGAHVHDGGEIAHAQIEGLSEAEATSAAGAIIARAENDAAGIVAKAEAEAAGIIAEAQAISSTDSVEEQGETSEPEDDAQIDANAEAEESAEPDFTKPAPAKSATPKRRPGRPAKA